MAKGPATRRIDEAIDVVAWSFLGKVVVDVLSSMMFDDEDGYVHVASTVAPEAQTFQEETDDFDDVPF